jgi:hypothetical protein
VGVQHVQQRQESEAPDASEAHESLLSVARAALFFTDLLALQEVLDPHRLITPEVELVVRSWVDTNAADFATLRKNLQLLFTKEPSEILEMTRAAEAMLQQLADRLPILKEHPSERGSLRHAS